MFVLPTFGLGVISSSTAPPGTFDTATLENGSNLSGASNILTLTIRPSVLVYAGKSITIAGLTGSQTADGPLTLSGAGASVFGSAGSWTQSTGTLVLTVDTGQTLSTGSDTIVTFTLTNPVSGNGVTSVDLSSNNFISSTITGTYLDAFSNLFSISLIDIELNIRGTTNSVTGDTAYGTDTRDFYVFDGTNWQIYNNL